MSCYGKFGMGVAYHLILAMFFSLIISKDNIIYD